ncbi:beta-lactamase [Microthyrium microscopicum]|uniref:Beta-lactamase n=1 Tax=Microthyrium microscopicum TaxID=703497 RepID=A0A6A6UFC3_9PEZI|nr:beta-lactamase [Microthyrium microscopicum]
MEAKLNSAFEASVKEKKVPAVGAIALDKTGKVIYSGAYGKTSIEGGAAFTTSTPFLAWSLTKLVVSIAALQLKEQGKLQLDDLVEKYVPQIKDPKILEGFNDDGSPKLREAKNKPTILNLLTHTSGLSYDWCNKNLFQYRLATNMAPGLYNTGAPEPFFDSPLDSEPGTKFEYGISIDILGLVVEAVSKQRLPAYLKEHIFDPLGMTKTGPQPALNAEGVDEFLLVHMRLPDGSLVADPLKLPADPVIFGGGHFLYSCMEDYVSKFLLTVLNHGTHPATGVTILQKKTSEDYVFREHVVSSVGASIDGVGVVKSMIGQVCNDGELLPGLKKSWSCAFMMNLEDSPSGRKAGSGAWCGFGNIYYWVDPTEGITGMLVTETLPFLDPEPLRLFDDFERAVYGHSEAKEGDWRNSTSSPAA